MSEPHRPAAPGDDVGLGRVVDNRSGLGHGEPDADRGETVEDASEASFPASDPPGFTDAPASAATSEGAGDAAPSTETPDLPGTELPDREDPV